jgi:hypothetical protein
MEAERHEGESHDTEKVQPSSSISHARGSNYVIDKIKDRGRMKFEAETL